MEDTVKSPLQFKRLDVAFFLLAAPPLIALGDAPWPLGTDFPVGTMQVFYDTDMERLAADGYNVVNPYGGFYSTESAGWQTFMTPDDYMEAAAEHGLYVNFSIGTQYEYREQYNPPMFTPTEIQHFAEYDNLYGWYVFPEEADYNVTSPSEYNNFPKMVNHTNAIRANDPQRRPITTALTFANGHMNAADLAHYTPYLDAVSLEAYTNYFQQPRAWVRWEIEQEVRAIEQPLASDNFNRSNSNTLGTTPIGGYTWVETEHPTQAPAQIRIDGNKAALRGRSHGDDIGMILSDLSIKDLDMSITFSPVAQSGGGTNYMGGLQYRVSSTTSSYYTTNPGYSVFVVEDTWASPLTAGRIELEGFGSFLEGYTYPGGFVAGNEYTLRVVADGDRHKIYLNGDLVIDYTDTNASHNVAGYLGLASYYGDYNYDNFIVDTTATQFPVALLQQFHQTEGHPTMTGEDAYHDAYLSLVAGAKSIQIFSDDYRDTVGEEAYDAFSRVAQELNGTERLGEVLLFGDRVIGHRRYDPSAAYSSSNSPGNDSPLTFTRSSGPAQSPSFTPMGSGNGTIQYDAISSRVMAYEGHVYILAVNSGTSTWTGTIGRIRTHGGDTNATVLFESRNEAISSNVISDSFDTLGVHVYKLPATADLILFDDLFTSNAAWSASTGIPTLTTSSGIGTVHRNSASTEWLVASASPTSLGGSLPEGGFIELVVRASTTTEFNLSLIAPSLSNTASTGWQFGTGDWQTIQIPFALEGWRSPGSLLLGIRSGTSYEVDSLGIYFKAPAVNPEPGSLALMAFAAGAFFRRRCP